LLPSKPPAGDNWLHEFKYDGYRLQIHLDRGRVTIHTRTGLDWMKRFSAIAAALKKVGSESGNPYASL
jgi:bifunctional non-homologous end joining protein LigD